MDEQDSPLCGSCAKRLRKYASPGVPELLMGVCPQCGGTQPYVAVQQTQPFAGMRFRPPPETTNGNRHIWQWDDVPMSAAEYR
jgi:hypothetical protein